MVFSGVADTVAPIVEERIRLLLRIGAVLDPVLVEDIHRLTHTRPRIQPEVLHDLTAVDRWPERIEGFFFPQLVYPHLELVDAVRDYGCPLLVACGDVAPHQLVELCEMWPGVTDVPANRRVGPSHLVRVRSHVEKHQLRDLVDLRPGEPQRSHPFTCHAGTNYLMVMERDTAIEKPSGGWFPDVVEQCSKAKLEVGIGLLDHCDRMRQDILVSMHRVLLNRKRWELRDELVGQA